MAYRGIFVFATLVVTSCGGKTGRDEGPSSVGGQATEGGSSPVAYAGAPSTGAGTGTGGLSASGDTFAGGGGSGAGGTTFETGATYGTATGGMHTDSGGASTMAVGGTQSSVGGSVATGGTGTSTDVSTIVATGGSSANATGGMPSATGGVSSAMGGTCPRPSNVLSDFETGNGTLYPVFGGTRQGYWYVYRDTSNCTSSVQIPSAVRGSAVDAEPLPTTDSRYSSCNQYAMHSSITNCSTYSGFGAVLSQVGMSPADQWPVDWSQYDGVSLWVRAGSGAQGPIFFEILSPNCVAPPPDGSGTASNGAVDRYNCHGKLLKTLSTDWQQVFVPFGTTGPRWIPSPYPVRGLLTCASTDFCEAPPLDTRNVLGLQLSLEDPWTSYPAPVQNYDVWIDDVALYKFSDQPQNSGLSSWVQSGKYGFPQNKNYPYCAKPSAADGRLIQDAFVNWKALFVKSEAGHLRVIGPENDTGPGGPGPTVSLSEGIAYGMLIAVYMGDRDLFDGLLGYWKANAVAQTMLMKWKIGGSGGTGSEADADEDAAFALQMATKQWGDAYQADADAILSQFLANDVSADGYLKAGSDYGSGYDLWNPSYFAPAYYRYFATVDAAHADTWNALVTNGYQQLANIAGSNGLVPAWCTSASGTSCVKRGGKGGSTDGMYQYDAHRTPWRIGLDQCWNGSKDAKSYLDKVVQFFASRGSGLSSLGDVYDGTGSIAGSYSIYNSMSLIGGVAVGAMGVDSVTAFRNRSWSYLLSAQYTMNPGFRIGTSIGAPMYTYHNATVGLLALLALSGNFYLM